MKRASELIGLLLLPLLACSQNFDPVDADVGGQSLPGLGGAVSVSDDCVEATYGEATYRACASLENYADASAECAAWGGTLVILESAEEETTVADLGYAHGVSNYWIGATDSAEEGVWQWSDGRTFWDHGNMVPGMYSHWHEGEPNNVASPSSPDENCAYMYRHIGWNDVDCAVERPFVCEKH